MPKNNQQIDNNAPPRVRRENKKGAAKARRTRTRQALHHAGKDFDDRAECPIRVTEGWTD